MKFLADENLYREITEFLRKSGYDIEDVKELGFFGISDQEVFKYALNKKRVLITLDKDFADIRFLPSKCPGVIVVRVQPSIGRSINLALFRFLQSVDEKDLQNSLIILEEDKYRIRKLD